MRAILLTVGLMACGTAGETTPDAGPGPVAMCTRTVYRLGSEACPETCSPDDKIRSTEEIACDDCAEVCTSGKPCRNVCILSGETCDDNGRTHTACRPK